MKFRNKKYDLALGLSNLGSYLSYFVNADKKAGFKARDLGWIYDFKLPDNREQHAVDYCLNIVKTVGGVPEEKPCLELPFSGGERESAADKIKLKGVETKAPLIAVHPGGKFFTLKRWPQEKFEALLKKLDQTLKAQIIFMGGWEDREIASSIIDKNYSYNIDPLNLAGELSIKESAALLERAELFVGNDSAPQHIAAAVKTPVISLVGPTNPQNFYPYGTRHKVVRIPDIKCSPCFHWLGNLTQYLPQYLPEWAHKCNNQCMQQIEVDQVLEEILFFLTGEKSKVTV